MAFKTLSEETIITEEESQIPPFAYRISTEGKNLYLGFYYLNPLKQKRVFQKNFKKYIQPRGIKHEIRLYKEINKANKVESELCSQILRHIEQLEVASRI